MYLSIALLAYLFAYPRLDYYAPHPLFIVAMSFQVKQELVEPELKLALGPMPMTSFTPPQSVVSSSSTSARRKVSLLSTFHRRLART